MIIDTIYDVVGWGITGIMFIWVFFQVWFGHPTQERKP